MSRLKHDGSALAAGFIFGLGLGIAQMINPRKVLAFLDISGGWDPSLAVVLGAAVTVTAVAFRWVLRADRPILHPEFHVPTRRDIDKPLVFGALIFGVGWGIGGYCPGPAIASLALMHWESWLFIAAMLVGSWLQPRVSPTFADAAVEPIPKQVED